MHFKCTLFWGASRERSIVSQLSRPLPTSHSGRLCVGIGLALWRLLIMLFKCRRRANTDMPVRDKNAQMEIWLGVNCFV